MAKRARLDHDFIYWGPEEVTELGADDIEAPDEVIRPGAYRWQPAKLDGEGMEIDCGHWVPLAPQQVKTAPGAPTLEQVVYDLITVGPEATRVRAWREWFKNSIDGGIG